MSVHVCADPSGLFRSAAQPSLCPPATRVRLQPASGAQPDRSVSKVELVTRFPASPADTCTAVVDVRPAVSVTETASA